jgi:hypothetical protein
MNGNYDSRNSAGLMNLLGVTYSIILNKMKSMKKSKKIEEKEKAGPVKNYNYYTEYW